ncbi:MAG TPA: hypothetical protein H9888_05095 [Candidatus Rikenella faecigallinarum]|uniref:Uncharacterized protein n=1 Tax=Candidatus Rikenella faecigallinarum TaxID=2838745 RepID=A0A9D1TXT7_9BACT|nr:hypothetical protein [Candidatus Rikenella faecigallinarum]
MENPIRELRKQGLLAEAHELGRARLAEEPDNLWIKRDLAWVCYDQAKAETESADPARLLGCLEELAELGLSHEETMLAESIDWLLGKRIGRVVLPLKNLSERWEQLRVLVVARTRLPLAAPSKGHSFYRQSVHRAAKDTPFYCAVMDAVGFDDGWMPEDYRTSTTPKGQKVMSLVEQIYIAYAKALLRLMDNPAPEVLDKVQARLKAFMQLLTRLIEQHPEYPYPLYFKAKLLLAAGESQQVSDLLLPFVRSKSHDFWVWQVLGEAFEGKDRELALSCYCRGLLCKAGDEMVVNLRESAARLMLAAGDAAAARYELERAAAARQATWNKASKALEAARSEAWFARTTPATDNRAYYTAHAERAEELLFASDAEPVLITYVNAPKQMASFIRKGDRSGFFKYSRLLSEAPKADTLYRVVFEAYSATAPSRVSWMRPWEGDPLQSPFYRTFRGPIQIRPGRPFGFVGDVFVEPRWVTECGLSDGAAVQGRAVRSYDRKKEQYGWRVVDLSRDDA